MTDFGSDLSCISDLDSAGAEVMGRIGLAQALVRRLTTPRGRLLSDANYGYDLTGYMNDDLGVGDLARIRSGTEAECQKDERVISANANVQLLANALLVAITIQEGAGPFSLVLSVSSVTVTLLSVS
jgi:hypothetical protein